MKKQFFLIASAGMICIAGIQAQITYEHSYPAIHSPEMSRPVIINMGDDDYKYMYIDFITNQLKLFNLDHMPYFIVDVPVPLINTGEYTVGYVTKSLFDCDTTQFEYAIFPVNPYNNFYIFRQDGTQLFQRDSSLGPWCVGCYSGAYDQRPIFNTPLGARLLLATVDTNGFVHETDVYALCGTMPVIEMDITQVNNQYVQAFPNPASGIIDFQFYLPGNNQNYELEISNSSMQVIKTLIIPGTSQWYRYDTKYLSSGSYFFRLISESRQLQTGKLIITK